MICELHFNTAIAQKSEPIAKHWEVSHVKLDALLLLKKQAEALAILGLVAACDMSDHSPKPLLELRCWYLCLYIFCSLCLERSLQVFTWHAPSPHVTSVRPPLTTTTVFKQCVSRSIHC